MALGVSIHARHAELSDADERRIRHWLAALDRRLMHFPEPFATVTIGEHPAQRRIEVDLRVELGPRAGELISHQAAETADRAVRLAVEDVERQLERRLATQRGEETFGVPSRREPDTMRPHPPRGAAVAPAEEGAEEGAGDRRSD